MYALCCRVYREVARLMSFCFIGVLCMGMHCAVCLLPQSATHRVHRSDSVHSRFSRLRPFYAPLVATLPPCRCMNAQVMPEKDTSVTKKGCNGSGTVSRGQLR